MIKQARLENLIRALAREGLNEFKAVELTDERHGLMVKHDYSGLYPSKDALAKCEQARKIAARFKMYSEPRGNKTATLIYLD